MAKIAQKNEKRAVAFYSILAAIGLIAAKTTVGLITSSLAILTDALHSLLDMGASIITYFAVKISDKPADQDHHFGHGKIEALAALTQVLILSITCVWIIGMAIEKLSTGESLVQLNIWAYIVIIGAIVIDISRVRALRRVAKKYSSQALEADALNFSTDIYSSLVVLLGLVAVKLGFPMADAIAAIGVALFIIAATIRLGKRSIDVLLDRAPLDTEGKISNIVLSEPGVIAINNIRLRSDGKTTFAELTLDVDRSLSFAHASELKRKLRNNVHSRMKDVDVTCIFRPVSSKSERIDDTIKYIVSSFDLTPHHLIIDNDNGGYFVSMHIELPGAMTLQEAHDKSTAITNKLHNSIKGLKKVVIYTQPVKTDANEETPLKHDSKAISVRVNSIIESFDAVQDCHNIVLIPHKGGLALSADMRLDGTIILTQTDQISIDVQRKLRQEINELTSITLHLEPFKSQY